MLIHLLLLKCSMVPGRSNLCSEFFSIQIDNDTSTVIVVGGVNEKALASTEIFDKVSQIKVL